jgi:hypothetical protein
VKAFVLFRYLIGVEKKGFEEFDLESIGFVVFDCYLKSLHRSISYSHVKRNVGSHIYVLLKLSIKPLLHDQRFR